MKLHNTVFALVLAALPLAAQARDTTLHLPLADAIADGIDKGILDGSVRFYLRGQDTPPIARTFGTDISNRKTNAFNKSDADACRWVVLSVLKALQEKAKSLNANAVTDIVSYYKKNTYESADSYECHAGGLMAGVTLRGDYARVDD